MLRDGFGMPTLTRGTLSIDAPLPGDHTLSAMALFSEAAQEISKEWHARGRAKAERREWLQKVCYQLLGKMIDNGFAELFSKRLENYDRKCRLSIEPVTTFQRGLFAVFAHDKGGVEEELRRLWGRRLWYAYRHYVPYQFLIGFLREVWTDGVERRVDDGHIEPDFEDWVFLARAQDLAPDRRGSYPAAIEKKVEQVKIQVHLHKQAGRW